MKKEIGVYIHIPFCKRKCFYCDFCSFECDEKIQQDYIKALISEIRAFNFNKISNQFIKENPRINLEDFVVKTLYIGGGTPSYISSSLIGQIILELKNKFKLADDMEATIEVNPGTASLEKMLEYKKMGLNRLSIGLQATNDRLLTLIGRIHNYEQFVETYKMARLAGFGNINVDLMIGLPTQTIDDVKDSLNKIVELQPEHISVYSLILEEGTRLKSMVDSKKIALPDEDTERAMYWLVKNNLEKNEYSHYEISNFAQKGYESKHNTDCWKQKEYLAFGLAAHSYFNNIRYTNIGNLHKYIENNLNNQNEIVIEEIQDEETKMNEYVILGLRMIAGFALDDFEKIFQKRFEDVYEKQYKKLLKYKLIEKQNNRIKLSNKGMDLANVVWEEFV